MMPEEVGLSPSTEAVVDVESRGFTHLHWTPVFAGAITAAALSFVLVSFGSSIGLAVASPLRVGGILLGLWRFWAGCGCCSPRWQALGLEGTWPVACGPLGAVRRIMRSSYATGSVG